METTRSKIVRLVGMFEIDSAKADTGNKAAGVRARKTSHEIGKLLKTYRKESVQN